MPELVLPSADLHGAFLACRAEWGPGEHEDGFGVGPGDDLSSPQAFARWVNDRLRRTHPAGTPCPPGQHGSPRWIVEDGRVLGGIVLRHLLDDELGQVGYGIRPSARRRGLASWALGEVLVEARAVLGTDHVLVCSAAGNVASARTIQRCGGRLDAVRDTGHGSVCRWWVPTRRGA